MQGAHVDKYGHNQLSRIGSFEYFITGSQAAGFFSFRRPRQAGSRVPANIFGKQQKSKGQGLKSIGLNKDR
jgi:hypothetical protein